LSGTDGGGRLSRPGLCDGSAFAVCGQRERRRAGQTLVVPAASSPLFPATASRLQKRGDGGKQPRTVGSGKLVQTEQLKRK